MDYSVPANYHEQLTVRMELKTDKMWQDLEQEDWFHGGLPMEDVEDLLQRQGDYCLRIQPAAGGYSAMVRFWKRELKRIAALHQRALE